MSGNGLKGFIIAQCPGRTTGRLLIAALILLGLNACSTVQQVKVDQSARDSLNAVRHEALGQIDSWTLEGRLAVSNEEDGGSGHFSWRKQGEDNRMDFHGALGRGAWRLVADKDGAQLELADGTVHKGSTIDELVRKQAGWGVPVDALAWWVRGLAAPGEIQHLELDEEGRPGLLRQLGWTIEYGRYRSIGELSLPLKVTARQAGNNVKLAIRNWQMPGDSGNHD